MNQKLENLIKQARNGDDESMSKLADMMRPKIHAFLFRVTLKEDVAEDLTQESMLQMLSSLSNLRNDSSFRGWLYRIAMNKANEYFRRVKKEPESSLSDLSDRLGMQIESDAELDGESSLRRKELGSIIAASIQKLRERQRAVVTMRCFDDMPYKRIAETLECTELSARVSFVRAKQRLRKELIRNGVRTLSLSGVLVLFGKATVSSSAASDVSIASASMESSFAAKAIGAVTKKKAAAAAAAGVVIAAGVMNLPDDTVVLEKGVNSVHYTVQARNEKSRWGSLSKGAYEKWCYFPEGTEGPMILRMQRWDTKVENKLCSWLQDENANHYYNVANNTVYLLNERLGGFLEMPTDSAELAGFIEENEPQLAELKSERDPKTGRLLKKVDGRFDDAADFETLYEYNNADPCFFEPFWPDDSKVVDLRTPMHKRGWTYFKVRCTTGERQITGKGRVPFVLSAAEDYPAWLTIKLDDGVSIVDTPDGAWIMNGEGRLISRFPSGSFLKGLSRPWLGYNTLDTVRRDAAAMRIPFETFFNEDRTRAQVVLDTSRNGRDIAVVYNIDLLLDLLESISISASGGGERQQIDLEFSYLQNVDDSQADFAVPSLPEGFENVFHGGEQLHLLVALGSGELSNL